MPLIEMTTLADSPRIAYLTTQYPSVSHTFIRREIQGLEALGYSVLRLSIRPGAALVDPADTAEAAQTHHCLSQPRAILLSRALNTFLRGPIAASGASAADWGMYRRSDRGLVRHAAYMIEAGALLPLLRRHRIQHVHVHFGTNAAAVARLMRRMGGPAFSMTVHGPDEFDAPVGLSLGDKMREAAFSIAVSSYGAAQLRRWVEPAMWDRIHVVHCTVGPAWFEEIHPVRSESATFVSVGRLSPQKGQLTLLDAFARAAKTHESARLVLVGDGELRSEVEKRIASHGLRDRVSITGWQTETQVRAHLREARVFVLPSFAEGLPVVIMEALAQERPVISTYVAGIPELVRPDENGWLVPAGGVDALAAAMEDALTAPLERLREMGRAGRARVLAQHSVETEVRKLDTLFREAIARGGFGH